MHSTKTYLLFNLLAILLALQVFSQQNNTVTKNPPLSFKVSDTAGSLQFNRSHISSYLTNSTNRVSDFEFPVSDCFTYTFRLKTGAASGQTYLKETFRAKDDQVYTTGYVITSASKKTGLIQLLDYNGQIAWSRSYEHPSRDISFKSIRQLNSGNLLIIGTSEVAGGSDKKILMLETNLNGTIQWSKIVSYPGYSGIGISPTSSNGIGFAGHDDSTVLYGKLDYTGNLVWLKRMRLMEKGSVIGMVKYDFDAWYIGYSGMDSAKHVSEVCRINPTNGNIVWTIRLGGVAQNSDFILHDIELINIRPKLVGIFSVNGGPWTLSKASINGTSSLEEFQQFNIPGILIDTTSLSTISPWAEAIAFSPSFNDPDIYSFKTINEAYPGTLLYWKKKFAGIGSHEIVNIERTFDGGFLIATNIFSGSNSQGYFLKTDSTGWIRNCEGADYSISSNMYINQPVSFPVVNTPTVAATLANETITVSNASIPSSYECYQLSCPDTLPEDPCLSSYNRSYRGAAYCDLGISMLLEDQNRIAVIGYMRHSPYEPGTESSTLFHVDAIGKLIDKKKMNIGHRGGFSTVSRMMDGNLLALGSTAYSSPFTSVFDTSYITITKLTSNFGFIWNKSFPIAGPYSAAYGLLESNDGSIFLNYVEGTAFCEKISLMKLDNQGNLLWVKDYNEPNSCIFGYVGSMTQDQDYLYMMNWASGNPGNLLSKIRKTDGSVVWSKGYNIPGSSQVRIGRDLSFIGNDLVVQGAADVSNYSRDVVMIISTDGVLKRAKFFYDANGYAVNSKMTVTQNQNLVFTGGGYYNNAFLRLDSTLQIINSKKIYSEPSSVTDVIEGLDGSIYSLGFTFGKNAYENDVSLKKYTFDGLLGSCFADTLLLTTGTQNIITTPVNLTLFNNNVTLYSLPFDQGSYSLQENKLHCSEVATCDEIEISNPGGICDTLPHSIAVTRNPGCTAPVYFMYDNNFIQVLNRTDTSMSFKCVRSGTTKVKAKIFTGCLWIEDSISFDISLIMRPLNLGPDTTICPSNTLLFNAGSGFSSYLWNNGSTDSTLSVNNAGLYYVNVLDACSNSFSDTVVVLAAPPIPFTIGADRIKCNNDTLHLAAPGGFLNYSWSPNYYINSTSSQQVVIGPLTDTTYTVIAEKTPGCFAYDTIHISVFTSPPIDLGNHPDMCYGDSILLDAGSGFNNYVWNNGITTQQTVIYTKGTYSVVGTTVDGCKSVDTVVVYNVYSLPVVSLNQDSTICFGTQRTLDAGSGFNNYLWNNGSTSQTMNVNATGAYTVIVTDNHGCKGGDTTMISKMLPTPSKFLGVDTAICGYGDLQLKPITSFNEYLWSTGSNSSSIIIKQPGNYWLQVKDQQGCYGKDTIVVHPKDCLKGFYMPTGFTPNRDEKNDLLRPLLFGNVTQYQFMIYNRWGELIFNSTDKTNGWDGNYKGQPQNSGVFVWMCIYKFEGEETKRESGTCVLIR